MYGKIFDSMGFNQIAEDLFRHLVISQLAFPLSKLNTHIKIGSKPNRLNTSDSISQWKPCLGIIVGAYTLHLGLAPQGCFPGKA